MESAVSAVHPGRAVTPVDLIAEDHVREIVDLSPIRATYLGINGRPGALDDFSPQGHAALADARRRTLARIQAATPLDTIDRVTVDAMTERLTVEEESYAAGLDEMALNVIASPLQSIREVFDLMPTDTEQQWSAIAERLAAIPTALAQWRSSLRRAAGRGQVAPRRQVLGCLVQLAEIVDPAGHLAGLPGTARPGGHELSAPTHRQLAAGSQRAIVGFTQAAQWLRAELLPLAPEQDSSGREAYELCLRGFLGCAVDIDETYDWGLEELARIDAEMAAVAGRVRPGATPREAIQALDGDPRYQLRGVEELRAWMQEKADDAVRELAGTHFDIPDPVRRIECRIAPTKNAGIYYTPPSDDFTRPGQMWWSVPQGVTRFGTWRELTTVYHEGVPGHHLQVAETIHRRSTLNSWRRLMSWTSGHGEGWALYAERLMAELGFLSDPGDHMGMLDGQSLRAARVVLDIGVHCGLPAPEEVGGGAWTYDKAWAFLTAHANMPPAFLRLELDRYLGWPGQAPSYKVGERVWLRLREEVRAREGAAFDLKAFHHRALDVGGVGLDTLRRAVLGRS